MDPRRSIFIYFQSLTINLKQCLLTSYLHIVWSEPAAQNSALLGTSLTFPLVVLAVMEMVVVVSVVVVVVVVSVVVVVVAMPPKI